MLDEDDGGAVVDQALQHTKEDADVERVEADAGLVQHEQRVALVAIEFGGELEPLRLAAGQRGGGLVEGEVAKAEVDERLQSGTDLVQVACVLDGLGDGAGPSS
ncbi:hypothetical protein [Streptomyces sp. RTd22]|uniref:hypothetical protein n=1 Tax=Streptomyces sp. RTd22 TaxID=1841249 RepID=UPI0007C543EC|nr:hypothetical protein [Streptomyces sp. RTd22]